MVITEIVDFCEFLSPTREEQDARNAAIKGVFDVIKYIWPNCKVQLVPSKFVSLGFNSLRL